MKSGTPEWRKKSMLDWRKAIDINLIAVENNEPPTEINSRGDKFWLNSLGQFHRDNDKPAIENIDGMKEWWVNGQRHRDNDKPAIENIDGTREWYVNDTLHRDNGLPAIEYADGVQQWWINGKFIGNRLPLWREILYKWKRMVCKWAI